MPEFVNPKWADERGGLQEARAPREHDAGLPKLLKGAKVGFTSVTPWYCYSPVKNAPETAKKNAAKGVPPPARPARSCLTAAAQAPQGLGCAVDLGAKPTRRPPAPSSASARASS